VLVEHFFYLARINVESAGDDDVLLAVNDVEKTILIHPRHIPGIEPAIAQGLRGLLRLVPVAEHHLRTGYDQFADLAGRQLLAALRIHDLGVRIRDWDADGTGLALAPQIVDMGDGGGLGQAVAFNQLPARQLLEL